MKAPIRRFVIILTMSSVLAATAPTTALSSGTGGDTTPPTIVVDASAESPFGNGWYPEPVTVAFVCEDAESGCATLETRECSAAAWTAQSEYSFHEEGENCLEARAVDTAGNSATRQVNANVDLTPPGTIQDLSLETEHIRHFENYVRTQPTWSWSPAADGLSGIQRYHARVAQAFTDAVHHHNVTTTGHTAEDASDGKWCVEVAAVDRAGNAGAFAGELVDESCAWIDTVPPDTAFTQPAPRTLYLADATATPIRLPAAVAASHPDMAYAVGGIAVVLESDDPGVFPSGVWSAEVWQSADCDASVCDAQRHECENPVEAQPERCVVHDTDAPGYWLRAEFRALDGTATDRADHATADHRNYTKVDIAVVERSTAGGPAGVIHWEPYRGVGFDRYEVFAVDGDAQGFPGSVRHVATVPHRTAATVTDAAPQVGETWTYRVVAFADTAVPGLTTWVDVTHGAEITYQGVDGLISQPVE